MLSAARKPTVWRRREVAQTAICSQTKQRSGRRRGSRRSVVSSRSVPAVSAFRAGTEPCGMNCCVGSFLSKTAVRLLEDGLYPVALPNCSPCKSRGGPFSGFLRRIVVNNSVALNDFPAAAVRNRLKNDDIGHGKLRALALGHAKTSGAALPRRHASISAGPSLSDRHGYGP